MRTLSYFLIGGFLAGSLHAAGPVIDNDQARVLDVSNTPGQKSQLHKHDVNRIMIHLDAGHMRALSAVACATSTAKRAT